MTLSLSKSLFSKPFPADVSNERLQLRILYKLESSDSEDVWVCSYRNSNELTNKYFDSNPFVPCHLKFAGLLVYSGANFDPNNLESLNFDLKHLKELYLLVLDCDSNNTFSLNESLSCFLFSLDSGKQQSTPVPLEQMIWVEDDAAELKTRNLFLVNVTLLLFSKLSQNEGNSTPEFKTGLVPVETLPEDVKKSVSNSLKSHLPKLLSEESQCPVTLSQPFENVKDKYREFYNEYTLGFGFESRGRSHALVVSADEEDPELCVRALVQTNVALPLEVGNDEDELSKALLRATHEQLRRLCEFLEHDARGFCCYVSHDKNPEDDVFLRTRAKEDKEPKTAKSGGKKTAGKGKGAKTTPNQKAPKKQNPVFNFLRQMELSGDRFSLKLDTTTGGLGLAANPDTKEVPGRTSLNLVFKFLMESTDSGQVPFGGVTVPLLSHLTSNSLIDGVLDELDEPDRLKFVYNPYELVDRSVLISVGLGKYSAAPGGQRVASVDFA